ncbi:hypothetical protein [Cysteiniphilum sp. 6C5]|uniref:hypothetical protein n=1 Tax=unclassified Cysteiniphilum TaxID=2610889 RepID=UPI003F828DC4
MSFKIINSKDSSHYLTIQKSSAFRNTGSKVSENDKSYFGNKATHKNGFYPEDIEQALIELSKDRSTIVLDKEGKPYDENPNVSRDGNGDFILSNDYYDKLKVFTRLESDNSSKDLAESMDKLGMIISSAKENSADNKQALRNFNANVIKGFLQTNDMETLQAKVKVEVANLEASLKFNSPSWWTRTGNTVRDFFDELGTAISNFFKYIGSKISSISTSNLQKRQAALELELKSREITDEPTVQQLKNLMADFDKDRAVGVDVSAERVKKFIEDNQEYKDLIRTISNQGKENSTALASYGTVQKEIDATLDNISSAIEGAYKAKELDDEKARNALARDNKFKSNYKPGVAKNRTQKTIDAHKMNFSSDLEKYFDERREIENRSSIKNNDNVNLDAKSVDHADQIKTRTNTTSTTLTTHLERYKDGVFSDSKNNENKSESNSDKIINQENLEKEISDKVSKLKVNVEKVIKRNKEESSNNTNHNTSDSQNKVNPLFKPSNKLGEQSTKTTSKRVEVKTGLELDSIKEVASNVEEEKPSNNNIGSTNQNINTNTKVANIENQGNLKLLLEFFKNNTIKPSWSTYTYYKEGNVSIGEKQHIDVVLPRYVLDAYDSAQHNLQTIVSGIAKDLKENSGYNQIAQKITEARNKHHEGYDKYVTEDFKMAIKSGNDLGFYANVPEYIKDPSNVEKALKKHEDRRGRRGGKDWQSGLEENVLPTLFDSNNQGNNIQQMGVLSKQ